MSFWTHIADLQLLSSDFMVLTHIALTYLDTRFFPAQHIIIRLPLTSHNRAEIDHIRLVFFQIRVEKRKRGPPSFQMYMILCLGRKSKQPRQDRVDPSDSESCIVIGHQT